MMNIVMNVDTGEYYSESPALKREYKKRGERFNNTSVLPKFAKQFSSYKAALRQSQKLSQLTKCTCAVLTYL
jgi:hypothetical protein